MGIWWLVLLMGVAYGVGSIPFGLIVGLANGVDPRTAGSGNIGATNLGRLLGTRFFALVFVLDMLKGLLPVLLAGWVIRHQQLPLTPPTCALWLGVAMAAICGHVFSLFLGFRGGKGVATSAGVLMGVFPYYTLVAAVVLGVWGVCFAITRIVSLSSILAAGLFPVVYITMGVAMGWPVFGSHWPFAAFAVLIAALVVLKHRSNITRLLNGQEPRFAPKSAR